MLFDVSVEGLLMDFANLRERKFGKFRADELRLNMLELDGEAINNLLPQAALVARLWLQPEIENGEY
jgi:hypothetical protein